MDTISPEQRSKIMAKIRSTNTSAELKARRLIHRMGYRYRLHRTDLPGTPNMVFPARRAVIFVNGCFWHCHENCKLAHLPKSREDYWRSKFAKNILRDKRNIAELQQLGWRVMVVWECELSKASALSEKIKLFLDESTPVLAARIYKYDQVTQ